MRSSIDELRKVNESTINAWRETHESTIREWRQASDSTINDWKRSNESVFNAVLGLMLLIQLKEATGLRESLAASEQARAPDDGVLRAKVDSWEGTTARYVQAISETERASFVREVRVPLGSGKTWQGELHDFVLMREDRLRQASDRYEARKTSGPVE